MTLHKTEMNKELHGTKKKKNHPHTNIKIKDETRVCPCDDRFLCKRGKRASEIPVTVYHRLSFIFHSPVLRWPPSTSSTARRWAPTAARCPVYLSACAARGRPGLDPRSRCSRQSSGRNSAPSRGPFQWPPSASPAVCGEQTLVWETAVVTLITLSIIYIWIQ